MFKCLRSGISEGVADFVADVMVIDDSDGGEVDASHKTVLVRAKTLNQILLHRSRCELTKS